VINFNIFEGMRTVVGETIAGECRKRPWALHTSACCSSRPGYWLALNLRRNTMLKIVSQRLRTRYQQPVITG